MLVYDQPPKPCLFCGRRLDDALYHFSGCCLYCGDAMLADGMTWDELRDGMEQRLAEKPSIVERSA